MNLNQKFEKVVLDTVFYIAAVLTREIGAVAIHKIIGVLQLIEITSGFHTGIRFDFSTLIKTSGDCRQNGKVVPIIFAKLI